jgi:hypothetical protein
MSIVTLVAVAASASVCGFHPQPPSGSVACTIGGSACCPADYICVGRGALGADGLPNQTGTCWNQQDLPPEALRVAHDYTPNVLDDPSCLVTDWLPPTMSQPDGGLLGAGGRVTGGGGQGGSHPIIPGGGGGGLGYPDAGVTYSGVLIAKGNSELIDMFVGDAGIYVVTLDAIMLLGRNGGVLASVASPRPITSAAFDGTQLVVADQARWTAYNTALVAGASSDLLESCKQSLLVSQNRFVCGPANDWDRVFYTYDTTTGALLASSKKYTYNGIPMRRVPGTDDFVAVSVDSSPSDFHLYSVTETGQVAYINESPYHGDFSVTNTYAFDGAPPVHLITSGGLMLKIYDTDCSVKTNSFTSKCFVKDGNVGALTGSQFFEAMDSDAAGVLYALVDPTGEYYGDVPCAKSCLLEKIEVASRTIMSSSVFRLPMARVIAFRYDAASNSVVVGYVYGTSGYDPWIDDVYPGYGISVVHY